MLRIGLCLPDDTIPRTVFWERFIKALRQSEFFTESDADILVPLEDTAMETNWPRYGNPKTAYVRGDFARLDQKWSVSKIFCHDNCMRGKQSKPTLSLREYESILQSTIIITETEKRDRC